MARIVPLSTLTAQANERAKWGEKEYADGRKRIRSEIIQRE
jgi:hypothetical protein